MIKFTIIDETYYTGVNKKGEKVISCTLSAYINVCGVNDSMRYIISELIEDCLHKKFKNNKHAKCGYTIEFKGKSVCCLEDAYDEQKGKLIARSMAKQKMHNMLGTIAWDCLKQLDLMKEDFYFSYQKSYGAMAKESVYLEKQKL